MDIFVIENNVAKPSVDILLIHPFDKIWEDDKSKGKGEAIKDFTFIHFYCSPMKSNPYRGYDDEERINRIISGSLNNEYEPSNIVWEAIEVYTKKFLKEASFSYQYLIAAKKGAEKMIDFFTNCDLDERTKSGGVVYKPTDLTRGLADIENVLKNFQSLEKRVNEELVNRKGTTKDRTINEYEK